MRYSGLIAAAVAAAAALLAVSCSSTGREAGKTWSSLDPLSIPLQVRDAQFAKRNIVPNASFEERQIIHEKGRIINKNGADNDFRLEGWEKIGRNVHWVQEASTGKHAVQIMRTAIQDETDKTGEGVLSGFIPVIPGNYLFTYDVKLKNITPNTWRLGTKLYDTINIRLEFFDKNKKPIDGMVFYPYYENHLDNSFKGYSFSNYWNIVDFGWAKVRARTYNYPFSEGDIPDNCRYVRIFMGLKGSGTMWVDNVNFRYSKWNFTTLERLRPFIAADYTPADLLIPKPKTIGAKRTLRYFESGGADTPAAPLILIPKNPSKPVLSAAKLLKSRLDEVFAAHLKNTKDTQRSTAVRIASHMAGGIEARRPFIFSIGPTELFRTYEKSLPYDEISGRKQAYFIRYLDDPNALFLKGEDPIGNYYAAATAAQLLDRGDFLYHHADIVDYPDFLGRSYLFDAWADEKHMEDDIRNIRRMSLYKFNKAYVGYGQTRGRKDWYAPDDLYKSGVRKAGEVCRSTGIMGLAIMVNPYYHFDYEMQVQKMSRKLRYTWRHGNPKDMQTLKNVFKIGLDAGAGCIMLMADDFVPHEADYRKIYSLWTPEDKAQFTNLQNAQAYMINELYAWLAHSYKGTRFEFCPPWYLNEFIDKSRGKAEQYFADLIRQIPKDVAIIWTGNTVRSLSHDMADIERYRKLIGRYPMLWDNTLYARGLTGNYGGYARYYPGKVRMCNLFEPLDLYVPKDFYKYNDGAHMYTNGSASTEIYKLKYATVADFEWNNNAYNADFSLWKVLLSRFGKETALELLQFNDAYYGLVDMCMRIQRTDDDSGFIKWGRSFAQSLKNLFRSINKDLADNGELILELKAAMDNQVKQFKKLASGVKKLPKGKAQI